MIEVYAWLIINGQKDIEDVPDDLAKAVLDKIEEVKGNGVGVWK